MKKTFAFIALLAPLAGIACSSDTEEPSGNGSAITAEEKQAVTANYIKLVQANYDQSIAELTTLKNAVDALTGSASPTQAQLDAARVAWVEARKSYGQAEAFRFYDGPIDHPEGPEGRINSWPIDENYVDYVVGANDEIDFEAGIINDTTIEITEQTLIDLNNKAPNGGESEANLATGWHVIEFLLWGQDLSDDGPGNRPVSDFVDGSDGAPNQARRRLFLKTVTDLLLRELTAVRAEWDTSNANSYASTVFVNGDQDVALANMLQGVGFMAGFELSSERMGNALTSGEQEDEHSCFSDTTDNDLVANAVGIENVYLGRYGSAVAGPSLSSLVAKLNPELDTAIKGHFTSVITNIKSIPHPFDQALLKSDPIGGNAKIQASLDACDELTKSIEEAAVVLGLEIVTSE